MVIASRIGPRSSDATRSPPLPSRLSNCSEHADVEAAADPGWDLGDNTEPVAADDRVPLFDETLAYETEAFDRERGNTGR